MNSTVETIDVLGFRIVAATRRVGSAWVTSLGYPVPATAAGGSALLRDRDFFEWQRSIRGQGSSQSAAVADFAAKLRAAATQRHRNLEMQATARAQARATGRLEQRD